MVCIDSYKGEMRMLINKTIFSFQQSLISGFTFKESYEYMIK